MVDDKPEDIGPQPDGNRPRREAPTLDLDAIEISDETQHADAGNAAEKPSPAALRPMAAMMSSAMVAAIVGAGAAALVIWIMAGEPPPPQVSMATVDALAARVAGVESKAAAPVPPPQVDKATVDALAARVAGVEKKIAAPVPPPQVDKATVDALAARVASVESKAAAPAPPPQVDNAALDALAARVAAVESKAAVVAAPVPSAADAALAARVAELEKSVATLREIPPPPPPDLSAINNRLAQVEAAAKTLAAEAAQRDAVPKDDLPLRRVVTASLLDVAVRVGEPYTAALAAAKPLAASADALKPLDAFAATGVPNVNALNRELLALLPKLSPAHENSTTGSGIVDRLQAGAARLVRIERTDAVTGNDRSAIVARVTAAAVHNDIAEARRELKTLAPADRAVAQSWIDKADARDAALVASRQFTAEAMAALGKPAQ